MKTPTIGKKGLVFFALSLLIALFFALVGGDYIQAAEKATLKIGGTGGALGAMEEMAAAFEETHPGITVSIIPHLGTRGGINGVLKGAIDIGLAGRALNPQELAEGLQGRAYARTPFLFATGKPGEESTLTYEMIAALYRGEIRKWPDGTKIRLILRPTGDVDILMLKAISPAMNEAVQQAEGREGMIFALDDQENCDLLEKIPGSFGTSTLTQILSEKRHLTILPLNGLRPDSIAAAGRYPHYKELHMVTGPRPTPLALKFIDFVNSTTGRIILLKNGNVLPEVK